MASAAAATIIQAETPSGPGLEKVQIQPSPQQAQVQGPLSDPGTRDSRQHGRHGWWGRRWREPAPPAEEQHLPQAMSEQPEQQTTEATDPSGASPPGRQRVSPKLWRHGRRGMSDIHQEGEIPEDGGHFVPRGMSGYRGYRYRCFMSPNFSGGPENTYIFREFDFM